MKPKKQMGARERSMRYLRSLGMRVGCTEHWNPHVKIRQDLFGFIDLIALSMDVQRTDGQFVAIQVVNTHLPEHIAKIKASEAARDWIACGGGIEVHNWTFRCKGGRGSRKVWRLQRIEVVPDGAVCGSTANAHGCACACGLNAVRTCEACGSPVCKNCEIEHDEDCTG